MRTHVPSIAQLKESVAMAQEAADFYKAAAAAGDAKLARHMRNSSILALHQTYYLSQKLLKRHISDYDSNIHAVDNLSMNGVVRRGLELGFLQAEVEEWKRFRSHLFAEADSPSEADDAKAIEILPEYLAEVTFMVSQFERRPIEVWSAEHIATQ